MNGLDRYQVEVRLCDSAMRLAAAAEALNSAIHDAGWNGTTVEEPWVKWEDGSVDVCRTLTAFGDRMRLIADGHAVSARGAVEES